MMAEKVILYFIMFASIFLISMADSYDYGEDIIRIPLVRKKTAFQKLMEMFPDNERLEERFRKMNKLFKPTNDTLPLIKYFDSEFYGRINIGKPGKEFNMIFDTEWSDSWVPSVDCSSLRPACGLHNRYNHRTSSTYKPDGTPFDISKDLVGYWSRDIFLVGQMNSTDQAFGEISLLPWSYVLVKADGVVGLGLLAHTPEYKPFFYNLLEENRLNAIFSIYINRDPTTEHGGSILFGGIDTKHQRGNFTSVNIISDTYWKFQMNKVMVTINPKYNVTFCDNGCTATADTSSNSIVGPPEDIKKLNTLIGAEPFILNRSLIPCTMETKGPKISFAIGDKYFQILGRDYIQKLSYSGFTVCLSAFEPASPSSLIVSDWRLGGAFLYQFYTAYDLKNKTFMIADAA